MFSRNAGSRGMQNILEYDAPVIESIPEIFEVEENVRRKERSRARRSKNKVGPSQVKRNDQHRSNSMVAYQQYSGPDRFRKFVQLYISHRACSNYIPDAESPIGKSQCKCGADKSIHNSDAVNRSNFDPSDGWSSKKHTTSIPGDSYGDVVFSGFGTGTSYSPYCRALPGNTSCEILWQLLTDVWSVKPPPFVILATGGAKMDKKLYCRVDSNTSCEILWQLLTDVWSLKPPRLVISVTGGAKNFFLKTRVREAFKRGLIRITQSTETWIITGGTATGVMQYVGESVKECVTKEVSLKEREMVVIGFVSWGAIDNNENLRGHHDHGLFPGPYNLSDCMDSSRAPLDHNHSHFICADNGTTGKYGVEIQLRADLEEFISRQTHTPLTAATPLPTPVVLLVLEGGPNTLVQAKSAVVNGVPIVVIADSGRAADILAAGYKITVPKRTDADASHFPAQFRPEMKKLVKERFNLDTKTKQGKDRLKDAVNNVRDILKRRHLITVFEVNDADTKDMDKAILTSLLKSRKSSLATQVELALIWNRSDIARDVIFVPENRARFQELNLDDALYEALLEDEIDFVQLFFENGVNLESFLTKERLYWLYKDTLTDRDSDISLVVSKMLLQLTQFTYCCSWSTQKRMKKLLKGEDDLLYNIGLLLEHILNEEVRNIYGDVAEKESESQTSLTLQTYPTRDLFIWAILFHRPQTGLFLWRLLDNPVGGALVASCILQAMSKEARKHDEVPLSLELMDESKEYEDLAVGVLNQCQALSKATAHALLSRKLKQFGGGSPLCLAGNHGERMEFIGHSAAQTRLSRIWRGQMLEHTKDWKVFLTTLFPLLIFVLIRFRASEPVAFSHNRKGKARSRTSRIFDRSEDEGVGYTKSLRVGVTSSTNRISIFPALWYFYDAPVTKYAVHAISHIIFLGIFTCVVLTQLHPMGSFQYVISWLELIIWIWAGTLLLDEIRQLLSSSHRSISIKIYMYLSSYWNVLDFTLAALLIATIIIRLKVSEERQHIAQITYAFLLMIWYLRFMNYFLLWKSIGPKIFMIKQMLRDLMFFICILLIFVFSFGFPMQALLHPDRHLSLGVIFEALYAPYFNIFGELMLDRVQGTDIAEDQCTSNATLARLDPALETCPTQSWLVPMIFAIYVMLTNVLLLNLLIAMFSYTFEQVQENSERVWQYYRFGLVWDSYDKTMFPPPIIVVSLIYRLIMGIARQFRRDRQYPRNNDFRMYAAPEFDAKLNVLEKVGRDNYLVELMKKDHLGIPRQLSTAVDKIDSLSDQVDRINEYLQSHAFAKKWYKEVQDARRIARATQDIGAKRDHKRRGRVETENDKEESVESDLDSGASVISEDEDPYADLIEGPHDSNQLADERFQSNYNNQTSLSEVGQQTTDIQAAANEWMKKGGGPFARRREKTKSKKTSQQRQSNLRRSESYSNLWKY